MKNRFQKLLYLFMITAVLFSACAKDPVIERPGGNPGGNPPDNSSSSLQFTLDSLPGEASPVGGLYAIVTINNAQNQAVLTDKKVALQHNGKYVSDSLALPEGTYSVSKFFIVTENTITRFVTPVSGSARASLVQKPLPVSFTLSKQTADKVLIAVARVSAGDAPEAFGYPAGSFNNPVGGEPEDPNAVFNIVVHPLIRIGEVVYDSIPVSFTITTWNEAGQATTTSGSWAPGKNNVTLPKAAVKYRLQVSKWGITDEINLLKKDVQEGTVYTLGGSRAAKKISSVLTYKLEGGIYKPETRDLYEYQENGRLSRIVYEKKRPDNSTYTDMTETFHYNSIGKVDNASQYSETNALITSTDFLYDQQGKMLRMKQRGTDFETTADVRYASAPGSSGISGNYGITIAYQYSQHYYTMNYGMEFEGGNNVKDAAITSHHSSEMGMYQYDFSINPYIHLNRPDFFLSQSSKNNVVAMQKTYSNINPAVVPYDFVYTYDADGYPKEVVKSYKTYGTNQYLYKIKTVFNY